MIVGNGLVATAFRSRYVDDKEVDIFASGVSNSRENRESEFLREKELLMDCVKKSKHIVYFGTCSVFDPELSSSPYVMHKKEMERLVRQTNKYTIFRLPQVVGKTENRNTLTNYIHDKIRAQEEFQVWRHAHRNLIDIDDIARIAIQMLSSGKVSNSTINIATPFSVSVLQIIEIFEKILKKKGRYSVVDLGGTYAIDASHSSEVARDVGISFDALYIENLIRKYYYEK